MGLTENIKLSAQIGAKSLLNGAMIAAIGTILSIISFNVMLFQILQKGEGMPVSGGHFGGVGVLFAMMAQWPGGVILFFASPIFCALYFFLGYKIALQTAIYLVWEHKAVDFIQPKVRSFLSTLSVGGTGWRGSITSGVMLKAKLLTANRNNKDASFLKRKVINYGLKRIKLDDIDFQQENLDLPGVISSKLIEVISGITKPSFLLFFILAIVHTGLFLCALYTR